MITKLSKSSFIGFLVLLAACSGGTATTPAPSANGDDDGAKNGAKNGDKNGDTGETPTETSRTALSFVAPCTAASCGEIPPSSKAEKPECTPSSGSCGWSDPDPNDTVSYRECAASKCGPEPDASVCPAGTTFKGAACGSENDGPCVWRSACLPPPSTTPCPDPEGCGPMPAIGVICKDGSTGGLECMKRGSKCEFQRTCE